MEISFRPQLRFQEPMPWMVRPSSRPQGMLEIIIKRKGVVIEHDTDHNLVVNAARANMAQLVAGQGVSKAITRVGVGTNGAAPSPADTQLTGAFVKPISAFSYPTPTSVKFDFEILEAEANGLAIVEFGLLCDDGSLFARRTRSGKVIDKSDDLEIYGYWTILF